MTVDFPQNLKLILLAAHSRPIGPAAFLFVCVPVTSLRATLSHILYVYPRPLAGSVLVLVVGMRLNVFIISQDSVCGCQALL